MYWLRGKLDDARTRGNSTRTNSLSDNRGWDSNIEEKGSFILEHVSS